MKKALISLALAGVAVVAFSPIASAQTRDEQARWDAAQSRFDHEQQIYDREQQIYQDARARWSHRNYRGPDRGPGGPGPGPDGRPDDDRRFATDYDASRYYRDDPRYQERALGPDDQVYRGSDGRYYCKRNDGTTGLIIGGASGALIGNVVDGGRNRVAGTLIGGALGAIIGKSVDQNSVRCR